MKRPPRAWITPCQEGPVEAIAPGGNPLAGSVLKTPTKIRPSPIRSNQEWSPCSGPAGVQPPPEATSVEEVKHSSQHKVHNLNPPPLPKREEAKRLEPRVKSRASVVLNEHGKDK